MIPALLLLLLADGPGDLVQIWTIHPSLEFSFEDDRLHFALEDDQFDFAFPDDRLHFVLPRD